MGQLFQSTHPRRVRPEGRKEAVREMQVSIHAPTKGATHFRTLRLFLHACFNPRTHEGCDTAFFVVILLMYTFQSTHPRRVRPLLSISPNVRDSFNPRTHEGCDKCAPVEIVKVARFQSTHPRRVRPAVCQP